MFDPSRYVYSLRRNGTRWVSLLDEEPTSGGWMWTPGAATVLPDSEENREALRAAGWQHIPEQHLSQATQRMFCLWGQLGNEIYVETPDQPDDVEVWTRSDDQQRIEDTPVVLAFTAPDVVGADAVGAVQDSDPDADIRVLHMARWLPPPQFGELGLVLRWRRGWSAWQRYEIAALPAAAQQIQTHLAEALSTLAAFDDSVESDDANAALWWVRWEEIKTMAHALAAAYAEAAKADTTGHRGRAASLPPITSAHRTLIPSHNATRAIWQTFGPGVQPSLWNLDPNNQTIELQTPNHSLVRISPQEGQEGQELAVLHRYVLDGRGPEGIKHAVGVLLAYADQTGGVSQKIDARVSLRQLLLHMGKPESHADDPEEQRRLYHTILYLARCAVHASDRPEDPRPPGSARRRKGKEYREYSPLLVIERVQFEETIAADGEVKLRVPREVVFHLGADYYHLLFGQGRSYFAIPTALVLGYHPDRQQQELLLAVYLSDMLAWNTNPWRVSFHKLMLQSALRSEQDLAHGVQRMRDAMRVLLALERLEIDGLLQRAAHPDVDVALLCELVRGAVAEAELSEATRTRLAGPAYRALKAADGAQIRERRRRALQNLLDGTAASLALTAGPLLREQRRQREAKRKAAAERDERALAARVVKLATRKIAEAASSDGNPQGTNLGAKRRGRPRKNP